MHNPLCKSPSWPWEAAYRGASRSIKVLKYRAHACRRDKAHARCNARGKIRIESGRAREGRKEVQGGRPVRAEYHIDRHT